MAVATFLASISAVVGVVFAWVLRPPAPVDYGLKDWAVQVNAVCDKKWVELDFRRKLRVAGDSLISTMQLTSWMLRSVRQGDSVDARKYQELKGLLKESARAFQDVGDANRQLIGLLREIRVPEGAKDGRTGQERDRIEQVFRHGNAASNTSTEIAGGMEKIDFANPPASVAVLGDLAAAVRRMEEEERLWKNGLRSLGADHCA
ncbi:hypothetical protein GCM10017673_20980 [Streptosporangium violaceochromogenes]|nr:hypothetical protein GCM10017673_20980 [Streptosporangium violaceochromogenes]